MARYPLPTDINWSEGFQEVPQYVQTVTQNTFFSGFLIAVFVIFASGYWLVKRDVFGSFAVGGFISWIVALFLWLGDIVNGVVFGISTAVMILSFASLWLGRDD